MVPVSHDFTCITNTASTVLSLSHSWYRSATTALCICCQCWKGNTSASETNSFLQFKSDQGLSQIHPELSFLHVSLHNCLVSITWNGCVLFSLCCICLLVVSQPLHSTKCLFDQCLLLCFRCVLWAQACSSPFPYVGDVSWYQCVGEGCFYTTETVPFYSHWPLCWSFVFPLNQAVGVEMDAMDSGCHFLACFS